MGLNLIVGSRGKRKSDALMLYDTYAAMASDEVITHLMDKQRDECLAVTQVKEITSLLVARMKETGQANKQFGKHKVLINTMVQNMRRTNLVVDGPSFQRWREMRAQGQGQSHASQSSAPQPGKRAASPSIS